MASGPRLYRSDSDERHATWLELFFDLVFVAAVGNLDEILIRAPDAHGLLIFAGLFVPVWWTWIDFSYYADQFESEDLLFKLGFLGVMFLVILLGRAVAAVPGGDATTFVYVYGALRVVMIAFYLRAALHVRESRELAVRYALSFTLALAILAGSLFFPPPARYGVWALAFAVEILNGPVTYATLRNVPRQVSHMDERFGLFVIVVLGEAVVSVARGLTAREAGPLTFVVGFMGFLAAAAVFLLHFLWIGSEGRTITVALRGGPLALLRSFVYGYAHLLLFAGITALGAAFHLGLADAAGVPKVGDRLVVAAALALTLVGTTVVQRSGASELPGGVVLLRGAALALTVGAALLAPSVLTLSLAVGAVLVLLVLVEHRAFARRPKGVDSAS